MPPATTIKAVFFDFMGTCLDWHSGTLKALPQALPEDDRSSLALQWRQAYFDANAARLAAGHALEDFDMTLRRTLDTLLEEKYVRWEGLFDGPVKEACVAAWHSMPAWPDVAPALARLKAQGYEVFVSANGTTRLQLDLCRSSGLDFDMLFSSELLGVYKPAAENYTRTMELVRVRPEECVMVAAHAWDTRGGKALGMKTVYIRRWTDDIEEDMSVVRGEHDVFLEDMTDLARVVGRF